MFSCAHRFLHGFLFAAQLKHLKSQFVSLLYTIYRSSTSLKVVTRMGDFIDREAQLDDEEEEELDEELEGVSGEVRRKLVVGGKKQRDFEDSSEEEDDDDDEEAAKVCFVS